MIAGLGSVLHADTQLLHLSMRSSSCVQPWAWTAAQGCGVGFKLLPTACMQSVSLIACQPDSNSLSGPASP